MKITSTRSPVRRSKSFYSGQTAQFTFLANDGKLQRAFTRRTFCVTPEKSGVMLIPQDIAHQRWSKQNIQTGEITALEAGKVYKFVTMHDGAIRLGEQIEYHNAIAQKYNPIRYAGTVSFDENGAIVQWNNETYGYFSKPSNAKYAGFGKNNMHKFKAVLYQDDNVNNLSNSPDKVPARHRSRTIGPNP